MATMSSASATIAAATAVSAGPNALNSSGSLHGGVVSVSANHCRMPRASVTVRNCCQERDDELGSNKWSMKDQITKVLSTVTAFGATALLTSTLFNVEAANAVDGVEVGALFRRTCAGCHTGGGNVLQPNATLFNKDLDRNGVSSVDDIYKITYFGKNRMPGYGEMCTPRGQCTFGPRLGDADIRALAEFVKSKADQGWTNVVT